MKTCVKSISVRGDYGVAVIPMRMPNGDLKRRFLMKLLMHDGVIPSKRVNRILLEVLLELDAAYRAQNILAEDNEELSEEVNCLQADLAAMAHEKELLEQRLKIYRDLSNGKTD